MTRNITQTVVMKTMKISSKTTKVFSTNRTLFFIKKVRFCKMCFKIIAQQMTFYFTQIYQEIVEELEIFARDAEIEPNAVVVHSFDASVTVEAVMVRLRLFSQL